MGGILGQAGFRYSQICFNELIAVFDELLDFEGVVGVVVGQELLGPGLFGVSGCHGSRWKPGEYS